MKEELLRSLTKQLLPIIQTDMSKEQKDQTSEKVRSLFEMIISSIFSTPSEKNPTMAQSTTEDFARRAANLPPVQRIDFIDEELFRRKARILDIQANQIAKLWISSDKEREKIKIQANEILCQLEDLFVSISSKPKSEQEKMTHLLADARMDCRFVLGQDTRMSLRLGRFYTSVQQAKKKPGQS
jgi:histidinol phosphatase-like PHP family hydrolase